MAKRYFNNIYSKSHESDLGVNDKFWKDKVNSLMQLVDQNASSSSKNTLYTGTTGIAYMFYHLAISKEFKNNSSTYLNKAVKVLKIKESSFNQKKSNQFICGDAGVNAVNAAIFNQIGDTKMAEMYLKRFENGVIICKPIDSLKPGEDELFVGRAGYLYGVLWLEKVFGKKIIPDQDVIDICSTIIESGRQYSKINKSIFPLMYSYHSKEYLGAAHGLCTILQVLISFPCFIKNEQKAMQDIKKCIDILISLQTSTGNFPTKIQELGSKQRPEDDELVHWCHGAPGDFYFYKFITVSHAHIIIFLYLFEIYGSVYTV